MALFQFYRYHQVAVKFFEQLTCEEFNYRNMNFVPATMAVLASVEAMFVDHLVKQVEDSPLDDPMRCFSKDIAGGIVIFDESFSTLA